MPHYRSEPTPPEAEFRLVHWTNERILYADAGWTFRFSVVLLAVGLIGGMFALFVGPLIRLLVTWPFPQGGVSKCGRGDDVLFAVFVSPFAAVVLGRPLFTLATKLPAILTRREFELIPAVRTATVRTIPLFGRPTAQTLEPADFAVVRLWIEPWEYGPEVRIAFLGLARADGSLRSVDRGRDIVAVRSMAEDLAATLRLPLDESRAFPESVAADHSTA